MQFAARCQYVPPSVLHRPRMPEPAGKRRRVTTLPDRVPSATELRALQISSDARWPGGYCAGGIVAHAEVPLSMSSRLS
jgi:hypothetical protein